MTDNEKQKELFEKFLEARIKREGYHLPNDWQRKASTKNLLWDIWYAVLEFNKHKNKPC